MAQVKFPTRVKYKGNFFEAFTAVSVADTDLDILVQNYGAVILANSANPEIQEPQIQDIPRVPRRSR